MAKLREREKTSEFFRFLNPIEHARTKESVMKYKVEPYVVVADIYDAPNMVGRGGWSWYTGSSSWLFMAGLEAILGVQKKGERLYLHPCIPKEWESFRIKYQYASSLYEINVYQQETKDSEIRKIYLDNDLIDTNMIILQDDQKTHRIDIIMN